jgi:8-hydroxy-5-deazaflavin:NADPH oxidoreductase
MRIGIIGSGHVGSTLARHFTAHGYEVAVSNSRGPDTLRDLEAELGPHVHAMTADEAAWFGDVVVVSVPFQSYAEVPADAVAGKVVIDTCNYYPDRDGHFPELDSGATTSSEMLAEHLPGARVVKAFNAIRWDSLRDKSRTTGDGQRVGIPISGDDAQAREAVALLVDQIGFAPVKAGTLGDGGRKHQPGTDVYTADLPGSELKSRVSPAASAAS